MFPVDSKRAACWGKVGGGWNWGWGDAVETLLVFAWPFWPSWQKNWLGWGRCVFWLCLCVCCCTAVVESTFIQVQLRGTLPDISAVCNLCSWCSHKKWKRHLCLQWNYGGEDRKCIFLLTIFTVRSGFECWIRGCLLRKKQSGPITPTHSAPFIPQKFNLGWTD